MKEFGSDFHIVSDFDCVKNINFPTLGGQYYSCGRQALEALINYQRFNRIWFPEYYCHDIINYIIRRTNIRVKFYYDNPLVDDSSEIGKLTFKRGDALVRMNYFGIRGFRDEFNIDVPVIEDHSHDVLGGWALNSNADWCIASLRKIFPIAEGGVIWSPKRLIYPHSPILTRQNQLLAKKRWLAMKLKYDYLFDDNKSSKEKYRELFLDTENSLDNLDLSTIDEKSKDKLTHIDLSKWNQIKQDNINSIKSILSSSTSKVSFLSKENEKCNEFSLILTFKTSQERDFVRQKLISNNVYPAILWNVPSTMSQKTQYFSHRTLSIACDGRYSKKDMLLLSDILLKSICSSDD